MTRMDAVNPFIVTKKEIEAAALKCDQFAATLEAQGINTEARGRASWWRKLLSVPGFATREGIEITD